MYGSSKAFLRAFALALAEEYRGKIDIIAQCPSFVKSPLTTGLSASIMVTPQETVQGTLTALGRENFTMGAPSHTIKIELMSWLKGKSKMETQFYHWLQYKLKKSQV